MGLKYASGKHAIAECDVCGFQYKLKELKSLVVKGQVINVKACPDCWTKDQPQLQLGRYPVHDPQAVRDPRPDTTYPQSRASMQMPFSVPCTGFVGHVMVTT